MVTLFACTVNQITTRPPDQIEVWPGDKAIMVMLTVSIMSAEDGSNTSAGQMLIMLTKHFDSFMH